MSEAARLEQALGDTERTRIDLGALVGACVDGYRAAYAGRIIEFVPPAEPVMVLGAAELLAQMLDKLVANAVEFATADPVQVTLTHAADTVELAVANTGPPLPAAMQERLFDSMVSVRPAGRDHEAHLGLGLYVVRMIAAFHGGRAQARDRDEPAGVVVSVVLPLA
jgi:signal transduction histidine kinase